MHSAPTFLALSTLEIWLIVIVVLLLTMIWCLTRHQECDAVTPPDGSIDQLLPALAGVTHSQVTEGNSVELIQDDNFFYRLLKDLDEATASIHLEAFLWNAGESATLVSDALIRAASKGVTVRVLVDARGSDKMGDERERMKQAGCTVRSFHRWQPANLGRFNLRDHRKIVVVDGSIAYVGGHCIADKWLRDSNELPRFRDISGRFRGPVVGAIQSTFVENWSEVTREYPIHIESFPELEKAGEIRAHVASLKADGCPSSVQVLHHAAIALAKRTIRIQNPYFLPDPSAIKALTSAVKRGVHVEIMTPAVRATDSPLVTRAGHFTYQRLLDGGVRIYEYQKTLLHQKVILVDDGWCGIGSSNFDDRSFEINDEITIGIFDRSTTQELHRTFEADLLDCREIDSVEWRQRPWGPKAASAILYLFNEQF